MLIDGTDSESIWSNSIPFSGFTQNFPTDSLAAQKKTEVKLAFDEANIYVFAKCYQPSDETFVQTLKRDFDFFGNEVLVQKHPLKPNSETKWMIGV